MFIVQCNPQTTSTLIFATVFEDFLNWGEMVKYVSFCNYMSEQREMPAACDNSKLSWVVFI